MGTQGYPAHTADVAPDGYIGHTAPTIDGGGGPAWSGFVVAAAWEVYQTYGDRRLLASALPAMEKLLQFWNRTRLYAGRGGGASLKAPDGLYRDWGTAPNGTVVDQWTFLGDWESPHGSERTRPGSKASPEAELFNNCYILYCTRLVGRSHAALGDATGAARHAASAAALAAAIHSRWFHPQNATHNATYLDSRQTHLVMPLVAGAVPAEHVAAVWAALREEILVRQAGHIDTGLTGLYFMVKVRAGTGSVRA